MELSERYIAQLESEGFPSVYEWQDAPGTVYKEHAHKGKVSICITDGSITFDFSGVSQSGRLAQEVASSLGKSDNLNSFCQKKKELIAPTRFDVPVGAKHSAVVGPKGAIYIVGEEIEGDS